MMIKTYRTTYFDLTEHDGERSGYVSVCFLPADEEGRNGIKVGLGTEYGHEGYLSPDKARALAAWLIEAADKQEGR